MRQQGELIGVTQLRSLEQTGFFANSKDLIQSGRIQIRVASLSLVSFRHLSVS